MTIWGKSSSHVKNFVYISSSSTCACRIIYMQEIWAKISEKDDKYGHMEASGCGREPLAHLAAPPGATRVLPGPPSGHATSPIRGRCSRANDKHPFKSVWSMHKIWWRWIHGPIVIDLGGFHRLTNRLTYQILTCAGFTTDLEEQPRCYDVEAVHPTADRRPPCAARHPRCSTDLLATYKYPSPHSTL
jgi:hypothetical protein